MYEVTYKGKEIGYYEERGVIMLDSEGIREGKIEGMTKNKIELSIPKLTSFPAYIFKDEILFYLPLGILGLYRSELPKSWSIEEAREDYEMVIKTDAPAHGSLYSINDKAVILGLKAPVGSQVAHTFDLDPIPDPYYVYKKFPLEEHDLTEGTRAPSVYNGKVVGCYPFPAAHGLPITMPSFDYHDLHDGGFKVYVEDNKLYVRKKLVAEYPNNIGIPDWNLEPEFFEKGCIIQGDKAVPISDVDWGMIYIIGKSYISSNWFVYEVTEDLLKESVIITYDMVDDIRALIRSRITQERKRTLLKILRYDEETLRKIAYYCYRIPGRKSYEWKYKRSKAFRDLIDPVREKAEILFKVHEE